MSPTISREMPTILVVDDEPQIHRFLAAALAAAGYAVLRADDGTTALRLAATRQPDLILLDLGLPDLDGRVVVERLRAFSALPILILSARGAEAEKVDCLDAGADDYVQKPFALAELLARIRAALRRAAGAASPPPDPILRIGPLTVDSAQRRAWFASDPFLHLTPREWTLLLLLARAAGRVLTQKQLLTEVWGAAQAEETQYLRVYIGHLRQKFGAHAAMLHTEPGVGYRLSAPEAEEEADGVS